MFRLILSIKRSSLRKDSVFYPVINTRSDLQMSAPGDTFLKSSLATSLIDFFFVRSLVASSYSREGGHCFDPASFFVLYLSRYLNEFKSLDKFISCLHDKDKGRCYRAYAGISS